MNPLKNEAIKHGLSARVSFAPVIGSTGVWVWTARGVRAFDADKEIGTFATMDEAAAVLLEQGAVA
jgi:hypothetical protein